MVQGGRRAARHRRGLRGRGALNVPFMQPWDGVPVRARLAPPGEPSPYQVQWGVLLRSAGGPAAPSAPPEARPPSSTPSPLCFSPASLDAFVFSYLALLLQTKLPSGKLQAHLRGLHNLCAYCTHILSLYFPWDGGKGHPDGGGGQGPGRQPPAHPPSLPLS